VTEPVVQVADLVKRYGELEAVRGINFEAQPGETFGFLGPNRAGKSTTIKILCTLANPTSGFARVAGHDVRRERDTVRALPVCPRYRPVLPGQPGNAAGG
jgi:ABC-2 type transport system ATP-binding protein